MSDDSKLGCAGVMAVLAFLWWATSPADDQVCRMKPDRLIDWMHGVSWQPTCQSLLDQMDARLTDARNRLEAAETRLEEVESKLDM